MKKTTFLLALLMAFGSVAMAQHQVCPERVLNDLQKQLHGGKWKGIFQPHFVVVEREDNTIRYAYEYDEDYMLTTREEQVLQEGSWTPVFATNYEYDFNYNVIEILTKNAVSDVEFSRETYTYQNGSLSEMLYQKWEDDDWVNISKYVYNYSTAATQVLLWEWDDSNWTPSHMYTYTEDGNTEEILIQYMQGGAWQNEQKLTKTYNDGRIAEILSEIWVDNVWENDYLTSYHYANGLYDKIVTANWDGTNFTDVAKSEYVYDTHGNAISGEYFCDYGSGWEACHGIMEMMFGENHDVYNYYGIKFDAEYIDVTGVEEPETVKFTFYPNPVNNVLTVCSDDFQKAEVYSMTGAKLLESTARKVDVKGLQAGMYLLKVYDGVVGCNSRVFVVK